MHYPPAFFACQLRFARHVAARFGCDFAASVRSYTTLAKGVYDAAWEEYQQGLQSADPVQWVYEWYRARQDPLPQPTDREFYGHALFGCFYYEVRNDEAGTATIIRPHFINNDHPGYRPLGHERLAARQDEMRRMFQHIAHHVPTAQIVLGNSWLYNVDAYCRIFPPTFTTKLPATPYEEYRFLALWGQCFDRHWQPKATVTAELLRRVEQLTDLAALQSCFPYAVRRPQCAIEEFYCHFGIDNQ